MKYKKIFGILDMAVILSLLVIALPASPVLANNAEIKLDPDEGEIGDYFDIRGEGFDPSTDTVNVHVNIYFSNDRADLGDVIGEDVESYDRVKIGKYVDKYGEFSASLRVPVKLGDGDEDVTVSRGRYYVYATYRDSDRIVADARFTVIASEIQLDIDRGPVGTAVQITGKGFAGQEEITVAFDDDYVDIESGYTEANIFGDFILTIIVPESTAGEHWIGLAGESGSWVYAAFTVEPEVAVTPTKGAAGDSGTVKGIGFGYEVSVTIEFDGDEVATDETDEYGNFRISFIVPVKAPGTYAVEAKDGDTNKGKVNFTIAASISLSQTVGNVGDKVTINGSSFRPNTQVTITYATTPVTVVTTTTDSVGKFATTFTVPKSKRGQHTITATDGTNTTATTFTVESKPPPVPSLLQAQTGIKAKSQASLDWEDVTDPSEPVTYVLQIATDEEFTSKSVVLQKTGLTESEYTLAKDESLKPTKEDAPYYWRVKAVDGAANESAWTSPGSFHVGFAFPTMPSWVMYTLPGLGALLLGFVGFWVASRRKSHSETS